MKLQFSRMALDGCQHKVLESKSMAWNMDGKYMPCMYTPN